MIRLVLATLLWAIVMVLGVWDYYIIKFPPCNLPKIYQKVLMPIVRIRAGTSTGSGVIISHGGTESTEAGRQVSILTAAHVVGNQSKVQVIIYSYSPAYAPNGSGLHCHFAQIIEATVVATDTNKDLALLRGLCDSVAKAKLAPRDYVPQLFTPVYAVGCSLGLSPRPSEGIVSVTSASPWQKWEISAPILPGNSGGGVFLKATHELIGIVVWVRVYQGQLVTTAAGVVPINQIHEFLSNTSIGFQYSEVSGHRARVTGAIRLNGVICPKKGQAKRSPYLRKAARETPKCNPLGTQHSEGGD